MTRMWNFQIHNIYILAHSYLLAEGVVQSVSFPVQYFTIAYLIEARFGNHDCGLMISQSCRDGVKMHELWLVWTPTMWRYEVSNGSSYGSAQARPHACTQQQQQQQPGGYRSCRETATDDRDSAAGQRQRQRPYQLTAHRTVTWYSTSMVAFFAAVWKKHSDLPAGSRNVNSLSWLRPKLRTDPKHQPKMTARTSSRPPLPTFPRRRCMVKVFPNTTLSKFSHLLRIPSSAAQLCDVSIGRRPVSEAGLRTNQRRKSSHPPPITAVAELRSVLRYRAHTENSNDYIFVRPYIYDRININIPWIMIMRFREVKINQ